jgi:hypothetical protein
LEIGDEAAIQISRQGPTAETSEETIGSMWHPPTACEDEISMMMSSKFKLELAARNDFSDSLFNIMK